VKESAIYLAVREPTVRAVTKVVAAKRKFMGAVDFSAAGMRVRGGFRLHTQQKSL
jgi:hypothetical protein